MHIKNLHVTDKPVSAKGLFQGAGTATALQIGKDHELKEHTTPIPALLLCISGEVVFENEKGDKETLVSGDYVHIEPMVKHWVVGVQDSQLVLLK